MRNDQQFTMRGQAATQATRETAIIRAGHEKLPLVWISLKRKERLPGGDSIYFSLMT